MYSSGHSAQGAGAFENLSSESTQQEQLIVPGYCSIKRARFLDLLPDIVPPFIEALF